jgi:hypothetical protein
MNTETFYLAAVEIGTRFGIEAKNITTSSFNFGGGVKHQASAWNGQKHINGPMQNSPKETLKAFEAALQFHYTDYSNEVKHLELT